MAQSHKRPGTAGEEFSKIRSKINEQTQPCKYNMAEIVSTWCVVPPHNPRVKNLIGDNIANATVWETTKPKVVFMIFFRK